MAAAQLLRILRTSALLQGALPEVRILALREAVRRSADDGGATQIMLENLTGSPFIPQERKDALAEMVLLEQWEQLAVALGCVPEEGGARGEGEGEGEGEGGGAADGSGGGFADQGSAFAEFRAMVVAVFSRSRKVSATSAARRRRIGGAIHGASSVDELKALTFAALETSEAFDSEARERVANDVLDDRYDLLLLPDRFDCEEEAARRVAVRPPAAPPAAAGEAEVAEEEAAVVVAAAAAEEEEEEEEDEEEDECPVCLGTNPSDVVLPCGHHFCRLCITEWVRDNGTCPMCRAATRSIDVVEGSSA